MHAMHDLVSAHTCFTSKFDPLNEPVEFHTGIPGRRGKYVFTGKYEKGTRTVRATTLRNKYDSMLFLYTSDVDAAGGGSTSLFFTDEQGKQRTFDASNARIDAFYSMHYDTRFSSIDEWITSINAHFSLHLTVDRNIYDSIYFPHYDAKQSIGAHIHKLAKSHSAMKRIHATSLDTAVADDMTPPAKMQRLQQPKTTPIALVDTLFTHVEHIHALCGGTRPLTDDNLRQIIEIANAAKTLLVCAHPKLIKRIAIDIDADTDTDTDTDDNNNDDDDCSKSDVRALRIENDDSDSDADYWKS